MKSTAFTAWICFAQLAQACLLPWEKEQGAAAAAKRARQFVTRQDASAIPIGTGDRFDGGKTFPRGLGTQAADTDLKTQLSVKEIESAFRGLANEYGFETFTTPDKTHDNATIFGGAVGGSGGNCSDAYRVYLNGAIHARERGSSDNIIYFIADLLYANKNNVGLTYGGRTYTAAEVKRALGAGIVFTPLSNPDGVAWDQANGNCWRKNRNPESAKRDQPFTVGVDLNRNFDFLWDFKTKFEPTVGPNVASEDPADATFHGTAAFSEPETRGIKWVLDTYKKVRWYVDLHSVAQVVLHSWGSDENQASNPGMSFLNETLSAVRGLMPDDPTTGRVYAEYIPSDDWRDTVYAATRAGNAMDAAVGRHFEVMQSAYLYPTSGASDDYAYARHFADPGLNKVFAYTIEFGAASQDADCPFYPTPQEYHWNVLEVGAAFMELLLSASEIGLGDPQTCGGY